MVHANNFGSGQIFSQVAKLAIPTMFAQLVSVLYGIVDRIYIGNIPYIGDVALSGVGVCGPILTFISSFASLVGLGGAPILAMFLGKGNKRQAEKVISNGFIMLIILAILLTTLSLLSKDKLLMLFGASVNTFKYADAYLTIYISGTIFSMLAVGLNSYLIAQGRSGSSMFNVLMSAGLNAALDPIFIFKFNMGVSGAAIATVISQLACCISVMRMLLSQSTDVRLRKNRFDFAIAKKILSFGFPSFLILGLDSILLIALNGVLQHYGGPAEGDILVTCATIVQGWYSLITVPMCGITEGAQPIVSFNYGAKNAVRVKNAIFCIAVFSLVYCVIMTIASHTVSRLFVMIFTSNEIIAPRSLKYIKWFTAMIVPLALQYTIVDELTAVGHIKASLFCSLFRKVIFLTCVFIIPSISEVQATFLSEPIADGIGTIVSCFVFVCLFKRILNETDETHAT